MPLLVLPTRGSQLPGGHLPAALDEAQAIAIDPADGPDESWDARVCAGITAASVAYPSIATEPLHILAIGDAALTLPAVARANRTCHRKVAQYALLEPDVPATSETWPDAPVIVFSDDPSVTVLAGLRDWQVRDPREAAQWVLALDD